MIYEGSNGRPPTTGAKLNNIIRKNNGATETETLASFEYSSTNKLSQITDKYGRRTMFSYDEDGNLTNVIFLDGKDVKYNYLGGRLRSCTDNESKYRIAYTFTKITATGEITRTVIEHADGRRGNSLRGVFTPGKNTVYNAQTWKNNSLVDDKLSNGVTKYTYAYNGNGDLYEIKDVDNSITICYNYDSLDRLVSSWQKIGESVNSYTYYSYDDMGRAYKSDFCLMGTAGGTLTKHKI